MGRDDIRLARLENRNLRLRGQLMSLQSELDGRSARLENSLSGVVSGAYPTSELSSFSPLSYNNVYASLTLNWTQLMFMYKTHGILQAAVDMPVQDAFRGGLDFQSDELDKDDLKNLHDYLETESVLTTFKQAEIWTRLFGGGGIIINGGGAPDQPLNLSNLKGLKFYAANRWEIVSPQRFAEYYTFYGVKIHGSRVLTMIGKEAPYTIRWTLQDWGMSEMERMVAPFNIFLRTQNAVYDLLKEAKVDVYQFEHLAEQLATNVGSQRTLNRISLMNQAKNNGNAVLLDAKDKFEQKQITFAGLAEIWKENRIGLASTMRIPMTKLFGISAAGFSSGEDDIENYNAMVESEVREHVRSPLRRLLTIVKWHLFGYDADLASEFKPLRVLSSKEEEDIKKSKHDRYKDDYRDGLLTAKEYMDLQQKEKLIPIETEVSSGKMPERPLAQDDVVDDGTEETDAREEEEEPEAA